MLATDCCFEPCLAYRPIDEDAAAVCVCGWLDVEHDTDLSAPHAAVGPAPQPAIAADPDRRAATAA